MIYINRNADYSANNIGQVEIPVVLDETAEAIMAKYTKNLSSAKQQAFSNLIKGMKTAGIFSKVEYLFLPCLAGTVSEAFYDAKNDTAKDVSDTSTYGQYSLTGNGLTSIYESGKSYSQAAVSTTRSTYAHTVCSVVHADSNNANYAWFMNQTSGTLRAINSSRKYFVAASNGNNTSTATINEAIGSCAHFVQSITEDAASWTPSSLNNKVRCNGEVATYTTQIESSINNLKTSNIYLAGYQTYGSSFCMNSGSIDFVALCGCLEDVPCVDDANTSMAERMDTLLGTFRSVFFG